MAGRNALCGRRRPGAPRPGSKGPRENLSPKGPGGGEGDKRTRGGPFPYPGTYSPKTLRSKLARELPHRPTPRNFAILR